MKLNRDQYLRTLQSFSEEVREIEIGEKLTSPWWRFWNRTYQCKTLQICKSHEDFLVNMKDEYVYVTNPKKDVIVLQNQKKQFLEQNNIRW